MAKITQQLSFKKPPIASLGEVLGALCLALLLTAVTAPAQDQSSQDQAIVKAAREKAPRKSRIVVTDDDMPSHPQPAVERSPSSTGNSANPGEGTQKQSEPAPKAPGQLHAPKDITPEQAQASLDKLKEQEKSLNRQYDEIQDKLNNTSDELLRKVYSNLLSKRDETLAQKRKEIESAERALQVAKQARESQGETTDAAK